MQRSIQTKIIKCSECGNDIQTHKWAPKIQVCANCKPTVVATHPPPPKLEVIEERPVDKLRQMQEILNKLGFAITPHGHHKLYQDQNATIRIEPYCDKGTSVDTTFAVEAFIVTRQEYVTVKDTALFDKIPSVALSDVKTILGEINSHKPLAQSRSHIDMVRCSSCGELTSDWITFGTNNQIMCLSKCAKMKPTINRAS